MNTPPRRFALLSLLPLVFTGLLLSAAPAPTIKPGKATGVYALGETAVWTIDVPRGAEAPEPGLTYKIKADGQAVVAEGALDLTEGPVTVTASRADAGALLVQIFAAGKTTPPVAGAAMKPVPLAVGGAIYAPEKIRPAAPEPKDFDAFWKAKLGELAQVPMNPVLEKTPDAKATEGVDYYKVTLDNIRGTKVRGQLARPATGEKFPALLVVQYAGVYPLNQGWVVNDAKAGWLVLNILAHDLPIDGPAGFYEEQKKGALKDYVHIGATDRDTSYFLRMFLSCARAADYLASRPDWDGKTLIVTGGSQGGLQALVTAALSPKVTAVMALVPAGCDNLAPEAGRALSWPYLLSERGRPEEEQKKVAVTAGYYDGGNFAARVRVPSLVGYGLADETSRPAGVAAAANRILGPKEVMILPLSNHKGAGGTQDAYARRAAEWKAAVLAGQTLPPASAVKVTTPAAAVKTAE